MFRVLLKNDLNRFFLFFILLAPVFSCEMAEKSFAGEHEAAIVRPDPYAAFFQSFETSFLEQLRAVKCPGAAIVVVKDTSIIYMRGFGVRSVKSGDPVDENTVFRIGSLSKGFAGVLTGKMVEQGYLTWDDRVHEVIPSFTLKDAGQAGRISVRNVLSHSIGLARHAYTNLTESGMSVMEIVPRFAGLPVYGKEGEYFGYQNAAFSMIEEVLRQKTGYAYPDLLSEQIFKPAGMLHASATYEQIASYDNVAAPHRKNYRTRNYYPVSISKKYYNSVSSGGVNASVRDMGQWLQVLLGNRPEIISQETLDYVFSPAVNTSPKNHYYDRWEGVLDSWYGMGWRIIEYPDRKLVYHGGYVNQYASQIAIDRESKIGICVLFNAPSHMVSSVVPTFFTQYRLFEELNTMYPEPAVRQ